MWNRASSWGFTMGENGGGDHLGSTSKNDNEEGGSGGGVEIVTDERRSDQSKDKDSARDSIEGSIPRHVHGRAGNDGGDGRAHMAEARESDLGMAVKMVKAVEEDAKAVAGSLAMLFSSLQSALSEVTGSSIEHMRCHSDAAGLLQDASIDAATKGNRFINACLRLNEEMKSMAALANQLKTLRQVVDQFEYHASRTLPRI